MPNYLKEALHKFQHPKPPCPQNPPHAWKSPAYGAKIQYVDDANHSPLLPRNSIHLMQQIVGTLIYYAISVDPTMFIALGTLSSQQYKVTKKAYNETLWLLNYVDSNSDATIQYTASDMILYVRSNALYLSSPRACSRDGGHYFLCDRLPDPKKPPITRPGFNGLIHTVSKSMYNVMGYDAKAKIGATYINRQEAVPIRTLLR